MTNFFISGGTGFLGTHLARHLVSHGKQVTVMSRDEQKLARLKRVCPDARVIRGDVGGDPDLLHHMIVGHDVVVHAAATKVVPMGETNVWATMQDNVMGTMQMIEASRLAGVADFVFVSTDKAVAPVNVYGTTKMMGERLVQEAATWEGETDFHVVRYGNVLGSTGSVIPLWEQMLAETGFITATDPTMTRFWLSIKDAIDAVEDSLTEPSGTVLVPLAPSMSMADFARAFFPDARFEYAGLRPGEKMHECLLGWHEAHRAELVVDSNYFRIWPQVDGSFESVVTKWGEYTSDNPRRWLTAKEVRDMVG